MKEKIVITINLQYGSDFQRKFAKDSLSKILASWHVFLESAHKKNKIKVDIKEL